MEGGLGLQIRVGRMSCCRSEGCIGKRRQAWTRMVKRRLVEGARGGEGW